MHYKNGREAKAGDEVIHLDPYGRIKTGVLFDLKGNDDKGTCNATLIVLPTNCDIVTIGNCLHVDDLKGMQFEQSVQAVGK
jgi:hypothetical protein